MKGFFDELESQNQNKTSYLRNLFNEYANMRKDKREGLCFDNEYSFLCHAINNKYSITCSFKDENYSLLPYKVDLNYIDGSLYLLALENENPHICHTFRFDGFRTACLQHTTPAAQSGARAVERGSLFFLYKNHAKRAQKAVNPTI